MKKCNLSLIMATILSLSLSTVAFAATSTPKPTAKPQSTANATAAANTYFANTLRTLIKDNPTNDVISARMIDLDGDGEKEMLVDKARSVDGDCYTADIYIYDYEKGKGAKTGTISNLSDAGGGQKLALSNTKNLILGDDEGWGSSDDIYTYKNCKLTCTTKLVELIGDSGIIDTYKINDSQATKAQYDNANKKYGVASSTSLFKGGVEQFINNELQSVIASDKTINSKADYKKTVYTAFINSGAYKAVIGSDNELVCYSLIPSDKSGNYDLAMIYTDKEQLNYTSKAQIIKSLDKTNRLNSDSFYRFAVYRNISGIMKRITPEWCDGFNTARTSVSILTNTKTGVVRYFIDTSSGGGDNYVTSFTDILNNVNLVEEVVTKTDSSTYYKNHKEISKAAYDKEMSNIMKDNKALNITYIPYS